MLNNQQLLSKYVGRVKDRKEISFEKIQGTCVRQSKLVHGIFQINTRLIPSERTVKYVLTSIYDI